MFSRIIILVISLLQLSSVYSQNKSNRGKEFWLGYGHNIIMTPGPFTDPVNSQELTLYLSTEAAANVTVSINGTSWVQNLAIPANSVNTSILIPKTGVNDARILTDGLFTKGIHIVSDTPIVVYAHQYTTQSSAATMLMPVETYGYNYYSLNFSQTSNFPNAYSWFFAVASENNTRLEITPSDTTIAGWLPTQTYTVNLNKGEIYNVFGKLETGFRGKDLTGSKIISVAGADGQCHPIGVFSGSSRNILWSSNCIFNYTNPSTGLPDSANGHGGELLMQQVFPANAWGTKYITFHTLNNTSNSFAPYKNLFRVAVKNPATIVKRNGVVLTGLQRNFYYEFASSSGDIIEADQPVLLAQYIVNSNQCAVPVPTPNPLPGNGDPEMLYLSPVEQGIKSTLFFGARRTNAIGIVYVNVIVPTNGVASMLIDGTPIDTWEKIPHPIDPNYTVIARRFLGAEGQHTITCDSAFTAINYGLGDYESFGYNAGCLVNNLNTYGQIKNTLNTNGKIDTFTCVKTPFRPVAKVAYRLTNLHWKLTQTAGLISNSADSIITNPAPADSSFINGRKYYHYTLQQDFTFNTPGIYTLPVTYSAPDIDACSNTEDATITINVKPAPVANFSISAQQCLSDTVRFTGTTSTVNGLFNYTSYLWNFDDATTQNTIHAKKRFATAGNHDVRYRVYADNGCVGDTTKTITITNGTGPQIAFTINGKPCVDSTLTFTSAIPPSANTTYWWDFGDGPPITGTSNIVTHAYASTATNRVVRHTATITGGCSPDTVQQIIPAIFSNPPSAPFTITGDTLCMNKPLQFTSAATGITRWNWNFGNGNGTQAPPFTYAYNTAGTFDVRLTINDNNGCGSAAFTQQVIIAPNPNVNAGPDKYIAVNSSTTLDATLTNASNYNILWTPVTYLNSPTILNPLSSPGQDPVTYTITVTDKTSLCTASDKVIITPIPKLYIPTGFTPNNDGKNDKWVILGLAIYPDAVVSVYSRWGEKLFETKNYINNPWSGYFKGVRLPIGSYVYSIQLNDDKKQQLQGTVSVIY